MNDDTEHQRIIGRTLEFMENTREDIREIKTWIAEVRKENAAHSLQASATAKDVGEIKAAMTELYDKVQPKKKGPDWKSVGYGSVAALFVLSFVVAIAAGKDGDLMGTLVRILGVLT